MPRSKAGIRRAEALAAVTTQETIPPAALIRRAAPAASSAEPRWSGG
ncbi:MAG: hypothetical protein ACKO38_16055 [Planctomycetota bacterium]